MKQSEIVQEKMDGLRNDIINSIHDFLKQNKIKSLGFKNGYWYTDGDFYDENTYDSFDGITFNEDPMLLEVNVNSVTNEDYTVLMKELSMDYLLTFLKIIENEYFYIEEEI